MISKKAQSRVQASVTRRSVVSGGRGDFSEVTSVGQVLISGAVCVSPQRLFCFIQFVCY